MRKAFRHARDHATYCDYGGGSEDYEPWIVSLSEFPDLLLEGTNVIAVETHNANPSSDVGFDLQLALTIPEVLGDLNEVPEPSTCALLGLAVATLLLRRRK